MACYASVQAEPVKTILSTIKYEPTGLPLPYYPLDTPAYNELKKSIYLVNQALANVCFNAQSVFDYYTLYNNQIVDKSKLDEKLNKFAKSQKYLKDQYAKYQDALAAYKTELAIERPELSDNIPIDSAVLL